jgi:hypothetical protein
MLRKITKTACFAAIASIAFTGAQAQTTTNRVEAKTDWSVFQENIGGTKQCWVVTAPTKVVNMRNGKKVDATRSEILLFVTYVPASGIKGEVSFEGGYPFRDNSIVQMEIGSTKYDLYPSGETAWSASPADDAKIRSSMQKGATAVLKAVSGRGTETTDTFSLAGFTAALADAAKRCQ